MAFPILSTDASTVDETPMFNTISTQFDGGYKQTRERHTRDLSTFEVEYPYLSRTDKDLIVAHYKTVKGSTPFTWVNIDTGNTHTVRYTEAVKIPASGGTVGLYTIKIKLEEV